MARVDYSGQTSPLQTYLLGMQGLREGQARGKQSRIASLYSQAFGAPEDQQRGILSQIAAIDPQAANSASEGLSKMDANSRETFARDAAVFSAMPPEQKASMYPTLVQHAQRAGYNVPAQYNPAFDANIAKLAQVLGGTGANGMPAELQAFNAYSAGLSPEDQSRARRIQLGLDPRATSAAIGYKVITGADGRERLVAVDPRDVGAQVIGADGFGPQASAQPGPMLDPTKDYPQLAANFPGTQVSSLYRTPEHNAEVGGVANSQHMRGTAGDFVVPQAEQAQFIARAKALGYEVIPEGDHVHVELPPGRQAAASFSAGSPFVSQSPSEKAYATERGQQQAQIDMAGQQGNAQATIEAAKQQGQDAAKAFGQIQQAGSAAIKERARLNELRNLLKTTYTGPGANMALGLKRVANTFGINVEGLGQAEAARALSNQLALSLRNPAGGEGMPGAMSDSDRAFLQQSVPSLSNTPQGWRAMIDMRLALADQAVKQSQYADQLRKRGVPIQDIPGRVQAFADQNPIFNGGASQPAPSGWSIQKVN